MSEVKRWHVWPYRTETDDGEYVKYENYAALERELAEVKGKLDTCMAWGEVTKKRLERELAEERKAATQALCDLGNALAELAAYKKAKAENDERYTIERDQARAELAETRIWLNDCSTALGETRAELASMRAKLARYGRHESGCGYTFDQQTQTGELTVECTCGLDSSVKEVTDGRDK